LHEGAANESGAIGLGRLPAVHAVRGLVSWARHDKPEHRPFPEKPLNGNGSLIAWVPQGDDWCWYLGASYQPQSQVEWPDDKNHGANVLRLEKLAPELCEALTPVFEAGALQAWKGVRCVTADRLPVVGSVLSSEPADGSGLWVCAGVGSRGLSHAPLCAELLAAQWAGEPWPIEAGLAESLQAQRK
jgi:tRNA 5-methylaminomethyl-2-thiouridine biosynthesis bifunctional protein